MNDDRYSRSLEPCPFAVGTRIELISMRDDPDPVPVGSRGTVVGGNGAQVEVNWDNGRMLYLVWPDDQVRVIEEDQ